ncbi:hypothetical protein Hamer_G031936, partial [Homarus americanus]
GAGESDGTIYGTMTRQHGTVRGHPCPSTTRRFSFTAHQVMDEYRNTSRTTKLCIDKPINV